MMLYALQGHSGEQFVIIYVLKGHYKRPFVAMCKHEMAGRGDCAQDFYLESTDLYRKCVYLACIPV